MQGVKIKSAGRSRLTTRGEERTGRGRPARSKSVRDRSRREGFPAEARMEFEGRGRKRCAVRHAQDQKALTDQGQQTLMVEAARVLMEKPMQLGEKREGRHRQPETDHQAQNPLLAQTAQARRYNFKLHATSIKQYAACNATIFGSGKPKHSNFGKARLANRPRARERAS